LNNGAVGAWVGKVGGWWLGHPSEKESQGQKQKSCDVEQPCGKPNNSWLVVLTILKNMGKDYPIYEMENKNVPNHQPG
jgi:hypothetical protein